MLAPHVENRLIFRPGEPTCNDCLLWVSAVTCRNVFHFSCLICILFTCISSSKMSDSVVCDKYPQQTTLEPHPNIHSSTLKAVHISKQPKPKSLTYKTDANPELNTLLSPSPHQTWYEVWCCLKECCFQNLAPGGAAFDHNVTSSVDGFQLLTWQCFDLSTSNLVCGLVLGRERLLSKSVVLSMNDFCSIT